jgi:rhodanese-related sulfurtransferase
MSKTQRTDSKASRTRTADARPRRSDRRLVLGVLGVVALVVAVGAVVAFGPGQAASTPASSVASVNLAAEISVADAAKLRSDGAFILDVRQPDEWAAYHIEGATLIPLGELASRVSEVPRDRTVVVVCHSGNRSAQGRDILEAAGYTNVTSMGGGLIAWQAAGQPTVSGS